MKTQKTLYHVIVDKSGSMSDCIEETITGYNSQLDRIRRLVPEFPEQEITVGLTLFDSAVECIYAARSPEQCPHLDIRQYVPRGSTALLDAIGISIEGLEKAKTEAQQTLPTTVVVVIITDGYENASRFHTFKQVSQRVAALQETGQWTFTYLGATLDAVEVGTSLNIDSRNNRYFQKPSMNSEVFDTVSASMRSYLFKKRLGKDLSDFYSKPDDEDPSKP